MNQRSSKRPAVEPWSSLTELFKLLGSTAPTPDKNESILRWLCTLFSGEGAALWLVVDRGVQRLSRQQVLHARSTNQAQQMQSATLELGEGIPGKAWAQGEILLLPAERIFDATPPQENVPAPRDSQIFSLGLPLNAGGSINGVIEIIDCSLRQISDSDKLFLNTVSTIMGTFISAQENSERLRNCKRDGEKTLHQLRIIEEDLHNAKARLSTTHQELVQNALADGQLFTQISRELRNPLSGILSIIELLQRTDLDQQQQEYAAIIGDSAISLLQVLQTLVEKGRNANRQVAFSHAPSPLPQGALKDARVLILTGLVGSAEFIEAYATASGIKCQSVSRGYSGLTAIRQAAAAGRPFDLIFVERVLPDMDAFEFLREQHNEQASFSRSTPVILVSTFGATTPDDSALDAGFLAHIAKPTRQAAIVNVVQAALDGSNIEQAVEAPQSVPDPATISGKPIILVAEDNPVNQKVALLQLKEMGYFAAVVANGKQALTAAKHNNFAAVLMDCQMPEMDGFQATAQIRQWEQERGKHTPIIAMTARALPTDREQCLTAGMDDYLSKPVTYDKLYSVLSRWLPIANASNQQEDIMDKPTNHHFDFSPDSQSAPVDLSLLNDTLGLDETKEILKLFVESSNELLERIDSAINTHDETELREATHTLKGACSSVGANEMWRECIELEQVARTADWSQIPNRYSVLTASYQQAKDFLANKL
jgi:CheY-like chemotaxis protein/HPt (histidine-containing phosphotransfer) domain-containing protein